MLTENDQIKINVRFPSHQVSIIDLGKELSILIEDALWKAYKQAISDETKWVLLNFSAAEYIDSAGIGLVTLLLIQAEKESVKLGALGLTKHYRNIFVITQLDQVISIFETEAEALMKIDESGFIPPAESQTTGDVPSQADIDQLEEVDQLLENIPWAKPVDRLKVEGFPKDVLSLNVEGRKLAGPFQGFGQLWHKTFRIRLDDPELTPTEVVQIWKQNLPKFKPAEKRFYTSPAGVKPG